MTQLVRDDLRNLIGETSTAHPGLLIQRGWTETEPVGSKSSFIERICNLPAPPFYRIAFERWLAATKDPKRFVHCAMKIEGRLLIGLTGGGALETGCAVSQTYGMPYLPGSSIKGAVLAWAKNNLGEPDAQNYIFGAEPDALNPTGLSGEITFHDAWWIPAINESAQKIKPFAEDVVTTHHSGYYGSEGEIEATDLDSPIPNAIIGVRGTFLFTLEGDSRWLLLARFMLEKALGENGIGAKTAAGYGYFKADQEELQKWQEKISCEAAQHTYTKAHLTRNVSTGEIFATLVESKKKTAPIKGPAAQKLLDKLREEIRNGKKIKEGKLLVEITVKETGNMTEILDLREIIN